MIESDAHKATRLREDGWPAVKILSALGYPGYGCSFAGRVLDRVRVGVAPQWAISVEFDVDRLAELKRGVTR